MGSGIKCSVYDSQFKGKMGLGDEMTEKEWPPRRVQTQEKTKVAYVCVMGNVLNRDVNISVFKGELMLA